MLDVISFKRSSFIPKYDHIYLLQCYFLNLQGLIYVKKETMKKKIISKQQLETLDMTVGTLDMQCTYKDSSINVQ